MLDEPRPPRRHLGLLALLVLVGCAVTPPGPRTAAVPPDHVFLITIDTLRADHLGFYGYPRATSPFLDALAAGGQVFEAAFAPMAHTAPSHASIMTGLYPAQHRLLRNGEDLDERLLTLARALQDRGYRTAAFSAVGFLGSFAAGFDTFRGPAELEPAAKVLRKARRWIVGQAPEARLFAWIHLYDVHEWAVPDKVYRQALDDLRAQPVAELAGYLLGSGIPLAEDPRVAEGVDCYDAQILGTDRALRELFNAHARRFPGTRTLWVVTSDHGEGLWSHGLMGHGANVYNELIRVPLVMWFSDGRLPPRRIAAPVRLVDLAPTLAEIAGGSFGGQILPLAGQSLVPLLDDPSRAWEAEVFAQRRPRDDKRVRLGWEPGEVFSLQSGRYKVVARTEGPSEVYDLHDDPYELVDLSARPPAERGRLLALAVRRYRELSRQGEELGEKEINPEHVRQLEALGYL